MLLANNFDNCTCISYATLTVGGCILSQWERERGRRVQTSLLAFCMVSSSYGNSRSIGNVSVIIIKTIADKLWQLARVNKWHSLSHALARWSKIRGRGYWAFIWPLQSTIGWPHPAGNNSTLDHLPPLISRLMLAVMCAKEAGWRCSSIAWSSASATAAAAVVVGSTNNSEVIVWAYLRWLAGCSKNVCQRQIFCLADWLLTGRGQSGWRSVALVTTLNADLYGLGDRIELLPFCLCCGRDSSHDWLSPQCSDSG